MMLQKLDQAAITVALRQLNAGLEKDWVVEDQKLTKTFKFKDFQYAFGFMAMCALYAERQNHHPEWFNVYSTVKVQLMTHDVSGISHKDFDFAAKMEAYASI
ncbi:4a-hydroxytetrahydrobiopterin dehydratase [Marinomonas transparens]|uniref:Putative pterin-4-alpha-carbinolamine dehydratase n=1 Tax=Marinomonas transparens TaxID=2795388 RepID=A0A934N4J0_9GAMM|nr:4a-hydroxytetrahydrobiopterin dehydratase [Marinomonas transparens]MBJ7536051.1 4a-hydroxytetrahydrobiopterin dehydratase [Marinomonas transparens]